MPSLRPATAIASLALAATLHAQPTVLYVDDDAPAGGDGKSWATAFRDLQFALAQTSSNQTGLEIRVAQGRYTPDLGTGNRSASFSAQLFTVNSAVVLSLIGGFAGFGAPDPDDRDPLRYVTTLSGDLKHDDDLGKFEDNAFCVVRMIDPGVNTRLDGFTITGGRAFAPGFPVSNAAGLEIRHQTASRRPPGPLVANCIISDNIHGGGGAGGVYTKMPARFQNCSILSNRSLNGGVGGIASDEYWWESAITLTDCTIADNHGNYAGGARLGNALVVRCLFAGNSADSGAGLSCTGRLTAESSAFVGNSAIWAGGGLKLDDDFELSFCTIAGNTAYSGGGIYTVAHRPFAYGAIFWGNSAGFGPAIAFDNLGAEVDLVSCLLQDGASSIYGFWASLDIVGNTITSDPIFRQPAGADENPATWRDNDFRLSFTSPCIDATTALYEYSDTDLDGLPRRVSRSSPPGIDMGAYEHQDPACLADINKDRFVDAIDLDLYINRFVSNQPSADLNHDGFVDAIDLDLFLRRFSYGC